MIWFDAIRLALNAITSYRLRSSLTALGIAVGIAAVVLLTSIGEGVHQFVLGKFTMFGTNLIAVNPGKSTTFGVSGALVNTVRPLSLEDAEAIGRLAKVRAVVPLVYGSAALEHGKRSRRTMVYGVAFLISYLSQFMSLHPGDIISTGTPPGVGLGHKPPLFLKHGDVVELGIEGLGTQKQLFRADA